MLEKLLMVVNFVLAAGAAFIAGYLLIRDRGKR